MINAQCNGVDIDAFIEVVKLGEDYYILRISTPTCMRREKVIRFLRDHGYHVNTESKKTAPGEGCHRTVTYIYNYRIDFKGNLTELADDVALISGYWKTQSQRDRKRLRHTQEMWDYSDSDLDDLCLIEPTGLLCKVAFAQANRYRGTITFNVNTGIGNAQARDVYKNEFMMGDDQSIYPARISTDGLNVSLGLHHRLID